MHTTPASARRTGATPHTILPPPAEAAFEQGLYVPLDGIDLVGGGDASVVVNGDLAVSWVGSTFTARVDKNGQPQHARATLRLRGAAVFELAAEAGADVGGVLNLATIPLPPFPVGADIEVSPFLELRLHLSATADGDARLAVVAPFELTTGHSYDGTTGHAGMGSAPRHVPEVGLPDADATLSATAELEVLLAFQMAVEGIPIGGPVVGTGLGVTVGLDPANGADADAIFDVVGGWAFTGLDGLPDIPDDLARLHPPIRVGIMDPTGPLSLGADPKRWARLYDVGGFDTAPAVLPSDTGSVVVGTSPSPWLATLDGAGSPVTQSTTVDVWQPNCMARAASDDILLAGTAFGAARVDRYSPTADPLWTRTIRVTGAILTSFVAIAALPSGGAVLAGAITRTTGVTPLLVGIDDDGNVEWSVELDAGSGSAAPSLSGLAATPAGDVIAVGQVTYEDDPVDPTISHTNALIVRVAADGTLLAGYALGGTSFEAAGRVTVAADGSYAIGGSAPVAQPDVWMAYLGPDDSLRWSALYRARLDGDDLPVDALCALASLPDGLLACGRLNPKDFDAWLLRLDAEGMPVWAKCYAAAGSVDQLLDVSALDDGVLACGSTDVAHEADSNSDLLIVRTSVDGMLHFPDGSEFTTQVSQPTWVRIADHVVSPLAPAATPVTLEVDVPATLEVNPATAFGELLTD